MARVAHQKSGKPAASSGALRGSKVAKQQQQQQQRKKHKVVLESTSDDKSRSHNVLSFHAQPPKGYTFIPAGNPELTAALKQFAKRKNREILAVTTTPHASRHELSREVHRVGFHFPTDIVNEVCMYYGVELTSSGRLREDKDDDQLFMRVYQKGQLVLDEEVRDQVTINTEAKQIIKDLFPNIPDNDLFQIIKTAFQLGDGKVGTADEIPLVRRAQLSVVAHIRHTFTKYDKLLRQVPYSEARHRVENETLQKLVEWRGDNDDNQTMEDTLREVVVISDEEGSDDEMEDGQLLDSDDLRVQPVRNVVRSDHITDNRFQSLIEMHSDEEAPRGYRFVPQVVRRIPVQQANPSSDVSRQQSRFAIWDQLKQEYRSGMASQQPSRVVERTMIDGQQAPRIKPAYVTRELVYAPEPVSRRPMEPMTTFAIHHHNYGHQLIHEPQVRVPQPPASPVYTRGPDGKLYERIVIDAGSNPSPPPPRQVFAPPPARPIRQYIQSRPMLSPVNARPSHRRTASLDEADTIIPSIEGPNNMPASPLSRRNPFEDRRDHPVVSHPVAHLSDSRRPGIVDLTLDDEYVAQQRRANNSPSSPHVRQQPYTQYDNTRESMVGNNHHQEHSLEQPARRLADRHDLRYEGSDYVADTAKTRLQYGRTYQDDFSGNYATMPRMSEASRPHALAVARDPYTLQSPRAANHIDSPQRRQKVDDFSRGYNAHDQRIIDLENRGVRIMYEAPSSTDRVAVQPLEYHSRREGPANGHSVTYMRSDPSHPSTFNSGSQSQAPLPSHTGLRSREYVVSSDSGLDASREQHVSYVSVDAPQYRPIRAQVQDTSAYRYEIPVE